MRGDIRDMYEKPETEFGVFTEGGIVCGDFYSEDDAWAYARNPANGCTDEDGKVGSDIYVAAVCPEHPNNPKEGCEPCIRGED